LEASMAARSEPAPLSLRLMTVKVAILYYPAPQKHRLQSSPVWLGIAIP
jgi:hypothetical protein